MRFKIYSFLFFLSVLLSLTFVSSMGCNLISRTPSNIDDSSKGVFNVLVNCTDYDGINITKVGDSYNAFITITIDNYILASGVPNYFMNTYPNNSLGVVGTLTPQYKIWRAIGRNENYWYESLTQYNQTLLNDTFSYSVNDGRYLGLNITNTSLYSVIINYTGVVELNAFRLSFPLSINSLTKARKYDYLIDSSDLAMSRMFDAEAYRNAENYTKVWFLNINNSGVSTRLLNTYYCNDSYQPTGAIKHINSPNCVLISSINQSLANTWVISRFNSSYTEIRSGFVNGFISGIKGTSEYYLVLDQSGASITAVNRYKLRWLNSSTSTGVNFNETLTAWTSSNDGTSWTQQAYTFDIISTAVRKTNEEFQFGVYLKDNLANEYLNLSIFVDAIAPTNHPIGTNFINIYNSTSYLMDSSKNNNHSGIMNILVTPSVDIDKIGDVNNSLYLMNIDGSLNYTINSTFISKNDGQIWITFNTSLVSDGVYRMNITSISNDNILDVRSYMTIDYFYIFNKVSPIISYNIASPVNSFNQSNNNFTLFVDITNPLTYSLTYRLFNTLYYNVSLSNNTYYSFSSLSDGVYYYNVTILSSNGREMTTPNQYIIIDRNSPIVVYLSPSGITLNDTDVIFAVNLTENQTALNVSGIKNLTIVISNISGVVNETTIINVSNMFDILLSVPVSLFNGAFSWIVKAYDYASNSVITLSSYFTIQNGNLDFNITYPQNTTYLSNITQFVYEIEGNFSGCYYSKDLGLSNTSFNCNSLIVPYSSTDGNNTLIMYSYNYLNITFMDRVDFSVGCLNPEVTLFISEYPYIEVNRSYILELYPFASGNSNIQIKVDNPDTSHSYYNFTYDSLSKSYKLNITFNDIFDSQFLIFGDGFCPTIIDNITGTFLIRQPTYITIKGYNNNTGGLFSSNRYINEFAYVIAEYSDKKYYDATLEKYVTPLGFKYNYRTQVYHTPYRNGVAYLKLYDNSTTYRLRLIDGDIDFSDQYSTLNMSKSYGTNIYLGQVSINGTNKTLEVLLSNDDLYPYSKLLNWASAGLIALVFFASLVLLLMFPNTPAFALIFGILFSLAIIFIRVVLFVFGY